MRRAALLALLAPALAAAAPARSLTLAEAVELGLRSDPALAAARVARDRADLAVLRSKLDHVSLKVDGSLGELFNKSNIGGPTLYQCSIAGVTFSSDPSTCMSMGGASALNPDQSPQQGLGTFNLSANLNVPVFSGLRVESNVQRSLRLRDASAASIRDAQRQVALSVARAYWAVRRLALLLEVNQRTIERLRQAEQVADGRLRAGLAPPIDKNRATLRRLQQEAAVAEQRGLVRENGVQLAVALGVREDLELVDAPQIPGAPPESWAALLDDARRERPELRAARLQTQAGEQAIKMAQSGFYPQLNALFLFQLGNNSFNPVSGARGLVDAANPFSSISGTLTTGFNLSMNFFDMLNTFTQQRDAKYEVARLREEERRQARIVEGDVRSAHARLLKLYERRLPLLAAVDISRDNLGILESRYKSGDALLIEYLDGQAELSQAELDLVDNTAQIQVAWLELQAALGHVVGRTP